MTPPPPPPKWREPRHTPPAPPPLEPLIDGRSLLERFSTAHAAAMVQLTAVRTQTQLDVTEFRDEVAAGNGSPEALVRFAAKLAADEVLIRSAEEMVAHTADGEQQAAKVAQLEALAVGKREYALACDSTLQQARAKRHGALQQALQAEQLAATACADIQQQIGDESHTLRPRLLGAAPKQGHDCGGSGPLADDGDHSVADNNVAAAAAAAAARDAPSASGKSSRWGAVRHDWRVAAARDDHARPPTCLAALSAACWQCLFAGRVTRAALVASDAALDHSVR